jgi:calcineurin-like phosphoesterase family protein
MTDSIIDVINNWVKPTDNLFHLGDWCLDTSWEQFQVDLAKIKCQNVFTLWGNHTSRLKEAYRIGMERQYGLSPDDNIEVYPVRYFNMVFLGNYQEVVVDGQYYVLSHYPIDSFNYMSKGSIQICGHSHGSYAKTTVDYPFGKRLDVSWDVFGRPLLFSAVKEICDKKTIELVDHHLPDSDRL